ncbi:hypothetical protein Q3C01_23620 [Bradyrhizobium sp. UFLA05-109]
MGNAAARSSCILDAAIERVRGFARHVANFDPRTDVSPVGMLPGWESVKPYVYSDAEIDALLTAALGLPPAHGLRRWTYHTLFGLIAVTGMHISKAMDVERDDVNHDAGVLTVRRLNSASRGSFHCIRRREPRRATTPTGAMRYSDHAAARSSSLPNREADCCTSSFIASCDYPERLGCGAQVIVPGHACTTSGIASPSGRCSIGIAKARTSSNNSQCSPLT